MDKFYVQCGPINMILNAEDSFSAAVSALGRQLETHLWIYDDDALNDSDRRDHLMLEALLHLDPSIRVSRRGFDRVDAETFGTPETVGFWHELVVGMRRLFAVAGVTAESMRDVIGTTTRVDPVDHHARFPR